MSSVNNSCRCKIDFIVIVALENDLSEGNASCRECVAGASFLSWLLTLLLAIFPKSQQWRLLDKEYLNIHAAEKRSIPRRNKWILGQMGLMHAEHSLTIVALFYDDSMKKSFCCSSWPSPRLCTDRSSSFNVYDRVVIFKRTIFVFADVIIRFVCLKEAKGLHLFLRMI